MLSLTWLAGIGSLLAVLLAWYWLTLDGVRGRERRMIRGALVLGIGGVLIAVVGFGLLMTATAR